MLVHRLQAAERQRGIEFRHRAPEGRHDRASDRVSVRTTNAMNGNDRCESGW